ncbi:LOW QUALITY PROTEIN: Alpha/Beta hydrolase fold containing protein [Parasponia andersonii]|uniref:Alpha/Beta hydrolase fold containing protein n=1 Tax=Parasponia andersonii TaxID=3476 RepID=A0A2P5BZ37_PARAD|nr:LOW QUALITY PROTEIN: Alpha/Beta hydrolase fold containing protein [Parasponia andersonii]
MEKFPHKISAAVFVTAFMPSPYLKYNTKLEELTQRQGSFMDSQCFYDEGPENPPTTLSLGPNFLATRLNEELVTQQVKLTKKRYGSSFIACDQDNSLEESLQMWMIEMNPPHEVKDINGTDHMVMFTKPLKLFSYLGEIAKKYN